jgi:hypothetical protein
MVFCPGKSYTSLGGEEQEPVMDRVLKIILGAAYLILGLILLGFAVRSCVVGDADMSTLACIVGVVCTLVGVIFAMSNRNCLKSSHA